MKFENICDVKNGKQKRSTGNGAALTSQAKTSTQGMTLEDVFKTLDRSRDNETVSNLTMLNTLFINRLSHSGICEPPLTYFT